MTLMPPGVRSGGGVGSRRYIYSYDTYDTYTHVFQRACLQRDVWEKISPFHLEYKKPFEQ